MKPLVIRNKDAKNINNNAAFPKGRLWRAHCVQLQMRRKGVPKQDAKLQRTQGVKTALLSTSINSDNLSEKIKNLRFVINNFIHKEDIRMRISKTKKFLTIILSIGLLFTISCGDRPTGSTTDGTIPSEYNGKYYVYQQDSQIKWLHIKDGSLYKNEDATSATTKPEFTEEINGSGNTYYYTTDEGHKVEFKFYSDYATEIWSSVNINYRYELVP